jgi:hypothetical protein
MLLVYLVKKGTIVGNYLHSSILWSNRNVVVKFFAIDHAASIF